MFDPGWLFLASGLALLAATVLVPAAADLSKATWQRDRALAVEAHRLTRLARYEEYLAGLDTEDPSLVTALAESQLNQIPQGRAASLAGAGPTDLSVFPSLEPPALRLREYQGTTSVLQQWTTEPGKRLWLVMGGAICVLIGLLPASRGWTRDELAPPPAAA